jgi:hypothetical protein
MFWDTKKLYLFQVTRSSCFGIHHDPVEIVLKVLTEQCVFCYVYYQNYLNVNNKSSTTKSPSPIFAELEQYALKSDVHDLIK